jgi:hypothetical protein
MAAANAVVGSNRAKARAQARQTRKLAFQISGIVAEISAMSAPCLNVLFAAAHG